MQRSSRSDHQNASTVEKASRAAATRLTPHRLTTAPDGEGPPPIVNEMDQHKFSFADAVSAVTSSFRSVGTSTSPRVGSNVEQGQGQGQGPARPEYSVDGDGPRGRGDGEGEDAFPKLSPEQLHALFEDEEQRKCVAAALDEAQLNWSLDSKMLGQRSEANRGMRAIVELLAQIHVSHSSQWQERQQLAGQLSGATGAKSEGDQGARSRKAKGEGGDAKGTEQRLNHAWETHDLLRAIDRKDHETILMIRDANFDLLLDLNQSGTSGNAASTPLGYCISLGKGWEGTSIVLTGALSKFVNNLPDDEAEDLPADEDEGSMQKRKARARKARQELDPRTAARLRKLRTSLKLAIDNSILSDQTSLLASYIQVLLMSEGQPFILESISAVQQALVSYLGPSNTSTTGAILTQADPISVSHNCVNRFVSDGLRSHKRRPSSSAGGVVGTGRPGDQYSGGGASVVAAVDDLVANAVGDLVLMALWDLVRISKHDLSLLDPKAEQSSTIAKRVEEDDLSSPLPLYFFARDDRVSAQYTSRLQATEVVLDQIATARSKSTLQGAGLVGGKSARQVRMWKCAQKTSESLQSGLRRLNSKDRLDHIDEVLGAFKG